METKESKGLMILKKTDKIATIFAKISMWICGIMLVGITLLICAGVFNRLVLHHTWLFVEEWSALLLLPISYLAFGYTLRMNEHLKMDLIVQRLPIKGQDILAIFSAIFSLFCLAYLIMFAWSWLDYTYVEHAISSGPMQTTLWPFSLTILIGLILMTIDMIFFLINRILHLTIKKAPLYFINQYGEEQESAE